MNKIIFKEFTLLFQFAILLGIVLSIPLSYFCWSILNIFFKTQEAAFSIGWCGLALAFFSIISWLILWPVNQKYIKKVDILKILKSSDENDKAKNENIILLIFGGILVPGGIIGFFTLHNIGGFFLNSKLPFAIKPTSQSLDFVANF